ncbi:MAG: hypothetical protein JKY09_08575, partial [Crocinitomicaceae bacterium]|nr:hypothetical protein [Crocinitomicaceae bacterium]
MSKIILLVFVFVAGISFGQASDKLKKEQSRLERKIADTKMLLGKSKFNTAASLNELKVIENQIRYRERLLKNYDNQIRSAELKVQDKEQQIVIYKKKVLRLKHQYKRLLFYAYKHRNKYGRMMFIFSAKSYFEAVKRNLYLKRIAEIQQKQFIVIRQHLALIQEEIGYIEQEKSYKMTVISEKKDERLAIQKDRNQQETVYRQFKEEEETILAQLRKEERNKEELRQRIAAAIRKEIEEAEAKRIAEEAKAKKAGTATTTTAA